MKKNLISVVILALVLANLILTAVLTISVLPQSKQANELINKVCAAIDLDLEGGGGGANANVPLDQMEAYSVKAGESLTINLKVGEDGVEHYAVMQVTLGVNTKDEDYKKYGTEEKLTEWDGRIQGEIYSVVSGHTVEEMRDDQGAVQEEILKALHDMYDSSVIVSVSYTATYN